jgi:hypothetical protein
MASTRRLRGQKTLVEIINDDKEFVYDDIPELFKGRGLVRVSPKTATWWLA